MVLEENRLVLKGIPVESRVQVRVKHRIPAGLPVPFANLDHLEHLDWFAQVHQVRGSKVISDLPLLAQVNHTCRKWTLRDTWTLRKVPQGFLMQPQAASR